MHRSEIKERPCRLGFVRSFGDGALIDDEGRALCVDTGGLSFEEGALIEYWGGPNIGDIVTGVAIDGRVLFYRTPEEEQARREVELETLHQRMKEASWLTPHTLWDE